MPRSRPASKPISYHKHTNQYYVTRGGRRIYLGSDEESAMVKYHRLGLGLDTTVLTPTPPVDVSVKELANRFLIAQQANWRNPKVTLNSYKDWLGRFIKDHPRLKAANFTVESFAAWKLSLKERGYSAESINHYLSAVRAMFTFAEETGIIEKSPKLRRVRNETRPKAGSSEKPLYSSRDIGKLIDGADVQLRAMILLALNCGFGPQDIQDLTWSDICNDRVTLPRSKTGISQTFLLWHETLDAFHEIKRRRSTCITKLAKRGRHRSDHGHVFVTKYWNLWRKDSVGEQFRKLCAEVNVPCYGLYRLRHCASTAMSLVTSPHVHRKFMRHSQLQQQVTYTHTPDAEVDSAVIKAKEKLLGKRGIISDSERNQGQREVG